MKLITNGTIVEQDGKMVVNSSYNLESGANIKIDGENTLFTVPETGVYKAVVYVGCYKYDAGGTPVMKQIISPSGLQITLDTVIRPPVTHITCAGAGGGVFLDAKTGNALNASDLGTQIISNDMYFAEGDVIGAINIKINSSGSNTDVGVFCELYRIDSIDVNTIKNIAPSTVSDLASLCSSVVKRPSEV